VTLKEVKSLYNDLQVIVNYNGKLLRDLTPRVEKWTPHQKLGDIFLQLVRNPPQLSHFFCFMFLFI
jgi:hypothetical protein